MPKSQTNPRVSGITVGVSAAFVLEVEQVFDRIAADKEAAPLIQLLTGEHRSDFLKLLKDRQQLAALAKNVLPLENCKPDLQKILIDGETFTQKLKASLETVITLAQDPHLADRAQENNAHKVSQFFYTNASKLKDVFHFDPELADTVYSAMKDSYMRAALTSSSVGDVFKDLGYTTDLSSMHPIEVEASPDKQLGEQIRKIVDSIGQPPGYVDWYYYLNAEGPERQREWESSIRELLLDGVNSPGFESRSKKLAIEFDRSPYSSWVIAVTIDQLSNLKRDLNTSLPENLRSAIRSGKTATTNARLALDAVKTINDPNTDAATRYAVNQELSLAKSSVSAVNFRAAVRDLVDHEPDLKEQAKDLLPTNADRTIDHRSSIGF